MDSAIGKYYAAEWENRNPPAKMRESRFVIVPVQTAAITVPTPTAEKFPRQVIETTAEMIVMLTSV